MCSRRKHPFLLLMPLVLPGLCWTREEARGDAWRITVHSAASTPNGLPVVAELHSAIPAGSYTLSADEGRTAEAQVFVEDGKRWIGTVLLGTGGKATYVLRPSAESAGSRERDVHFEPAGKNLRILINGRLFTEYRTDVGAKPFLFPLIGPTEASYTRAYPMKDVPGEDRDHPHQRSFWFTHGKVNGVDFWSEQKGHGRILETGRAEVTFGPVLARLRTRDDWVNSDGAKVCEDERVLSVFNTPQARILDFEIAIKAAHGPVTFGDTKEGMFGVRMASTMDVAKKTGGKITNAEGLSDEKAWGKASPWVDYTGPVSGKTVGIAILNHPKSFRHPTTWHVRTYGLFAANPFGWHDFGMGRSGEYVLPAGQTLWFGYRLILHGGDTSSAHLPEAYQSYSTPPSVEVSGG